MCRLSTCPFVQASRSDLTHIHSSSAVFSITQVAIRTADCLHPRHSPMEGINSTCLGGRSAAVHTAPRLRHVMPPHQPFACRASCKPLEDLRKQTQQLAADVTHAAKNAAISVAGMLCATSLLLAPPAVAEGTTMIRLPASSDPSIFAAQRTLVEAWSIIAESFVDASFNHHDWEDELRNRMVSAYQAEQADAAFDEISQMLKDLGDPYTRRIPPGEYTDFRVTSDGEFQGVGLLIANEPSAETKHLRVLEPIKGGPADRAGILPGDEVLSINGISAEGWTGERAAQVLRGANGSEVRVSLARRTEQIPGVPGRPEPQPQVQFQEVRLKRERVSLSPLYHTMLQPEGPAGPHVGYLRLTNFSQNAAVEMNRAIQQLTGDGVDSFILDLRSNPGGLVDASVDIAKLWMDGQPTVFTVSGRQDELMTRVAAKSGHAMTSAPLVVLVNENSASASEILSGALRDNGRAVIVGDHATYGKGKIQSVFELQDGSALFVTVAKYRTPDGTDIDRKGIRPDRACALPLLASVKPADAFPGPPPPPIPGKAQEGASPGLPGRDNENFMPGLPVGPGGPEALAVQLASDRCVLAAEKLLKEQVKVMMASHSNSDTLQPVRIAVLPSAALEAHNVSSDK